MSSSVLGVLHFDRHDGLGWGAIVFLVVVSHGSQIHRKRGVQSVCQQGELELHLQSKNEFCCWSKMRKFNCERNVGCEETVTCWRSYSVGVGAEILTFFFSSTEMALASLRKMAFPHRSSLSDVN